MSAEVDGGMENEARGGLRPAASQLNEEHSQQMTNRVDSVRVFIWRKQ